MIILDTNIVSEFMKGLPSMAVLNWLNEQDTASLYFTSVSIAEISYGLMAMPSGKKRNLLEQKFRQFIDLAFQQRILSFDQKAATIYGDLMAEMRLSGHPMSCFDGQIASIALGNDFAIATRNVKDFKYCRISLIDPFEVVR